MIFGSPDTPRANYMTDDRELRENYEIKALNLSDLDDITAEDIEEYEEIDADVADAIETALANNNLYAEDFTTDEWSRYLALGLITAKEG